MPSLKVLLNLVTFHGIRFINGPFPIGFCLCVSTSSCEIIDMKMSFPTGLFSCKSNLFSRVFHKDSFRNIGTRELGNGLFATAPRQHQTLLQLSASYRNLLKRKRRNTCLMLRCDTLKCYSTSEMNSEMNCTRLITIFVGIVAVATC